MYCTELTDAVEARLGKQRPRCSDGHPIHDLVQQCRDPVRQPMLNPQATTVPMMEILPLSKEKVAVGVSN